MILSPILPPSDNGTTHRLKTGSLRPEPLTGPADPVTKMKHRLKTIAGRAVYAKRKCTVEPVFRHHQGGHGLPRSFCGASNWSPENGIWSASHTTSRGCMP